ncbi:3-octaprenyl-4-hydroxybenzoate carboxy-lyase [Alcanivorax sp. ALC70]|nr:3-octaprenyl-4-hydroxybenzoate carboxy-lyase [Alcanivorax sp. ALC70]
MPFRMYDRASARWHPIYLGLYCFRISIIHRRRRGGLLYCGHLVTGETFFMKYRCLRDFIPQLGQQGELKRIHLQAAPHIEMAEIRDRTLGPALLFENHKGGSIPVLGNLFGADQRHGIPHRPYETDQDQARVLRLHEAQVILVFFPHGPATQNAPSSPGRFVFLAGLKCSRLPLVWLLYRGSPIVRRRWPLKRGNYNRPVDAIFRTSSPEPELPHDRTLSGF